MCAEKWLNDSTGTPPDAVKVLLVIMPLLIPCKSGILAVRFMMHKT
jgi:hypothetical protein